MNRYSLVYSSFIFGLPCRKVFGAWGQVAKVFEGCESWKELNSGTFGNGNADVDPRPAPVPHDGAAIEGVEEDPGAAVEKPQQPHYSSKKKEYFAAALKVLESHPGQALTRQAIIG